MATVDLGCQQSPSFVFGCIADVQYADAEDGHNYHKTHRRYYRNSLMLCERAYKDFEADRCSFVLQLGDIIDGQCGRKGYADRALDAIMGIISAHPSLPTLHVWGNHDLVCFKRTQLYDSTLRPPDATVNAIGTANVVDYNRPVDAAYYAFTFKNVRFVALDTYEISVHGYPAEHERYKLAHETLLKHNKHASKDWNDARGLDHELKRYVAYNGAVTDAQLNWLSTQCRAAVQNGQRLILFCHAPLNSRAHAPHRRSVADSICWNSEAVCSTVKRDYIDSMRRNVIVLSGHTHHHGHYFESVHRQEKSVIADQTSSSASAGHRPYAGSVGIHHLVLPGIIECPPESGASHWVVRVHDRHIEFDGSEPHVRSVSVIC